MSKIINKGIGAGGAKTTEYGKKFEQLTCVQNNLLMDKYTKKVLCSSSKYAFCLNNYFKTKFNESEKYKLLAKILAEDNIPIFFGEDEDYFEKLNDWICFN